MQSPRSTLFTYTTLFRSQSRPMGCVRHAQHHPDIDALHWFERHIRTSHRNFDRHRCRGQGGSGRMSQPPLPVRAAQPRLADVADRKSTRLNSSHTVISYAVSEIYTLYLHDALPISVSADGMRTPCSASP